MHEPRVCLKNKKRNFSEHATSVCVSLRIAGAAREGRESRGLVTAQVAAPLPPTCLLNYFRGGPERSSKCTSDEESI